MLVFLSIISPSSSCVLTIIKPFWYVCSVYSKMEVSMPKFQMEQSYSLQNILPHMGIASVFTEKANLTKINKDGGLKLSEVSFNFNTLFQHNVPLQTLHTFFGVFS